MFDRVVVISLACRPHRLTAFQARLRSAWPGVGCQVFTAVDGVSETIPAGWKGTPGAWGCVRSHAAVLDQAIADGIGSVLIFEDDATFRPGFADRMARMEIPADCEQLYLGGQHLARPSPAWPGFVRGRNVNRTHAYAVIGRSAMLKLAEHVKWNPSTWTARHHVDHHYGLLHQRGQISVYAVKPFICGQAANISDVDGKKRPARVWS